MLVSFEGQQKQTQEATGADGFAVASSASASMPSPRVRGRGGGNVSVARVVPLATSQFQDALAGYIDENKPDPLVRRQMERWTLEWHQDDGDDAEEFGQTEGDGGLPSFNPSPRAGQEEATDAAQVYQMSGRVVWRGDHLQVTLRTCCRWSSDETVETDRNGGGGGGWLHFSCAARAEPAAIYDRDERSSKDGGQGLSADRGDAKVRRQMLRRLQEDDYVRKLLVPTATHLSKTKKKGDGTQQQRHQHGVLLCQADIFVRQSTNELEERVYTDESVAEALRRAVWGTNPEPLDVLDFVLQLPVLPCTKTSTASTATTTPLADRAQLRLLEDAMYDACEREGDDELVEAMEISQNQKQQQPQRQQQNLEPPAGKRKKRR